MFTGIVEGVGEVVDVRENQDNVDFLMSCSFVEELKVDQSLAHNGVCLTVTDIQDGMYWVTAVKETLLKSNLGQWKKGYKVNLERAMLLNSRLDGHMVQGHVDMTALCEKITSENGSWLFTFKLEEAHQGLLVPKGSITVNGVSLTVIEPQEKVFSVAIIPYTYEHTSFKLLKEGDKVNIEFDVIGKYVINQAALYKSK